MGVKRMQIRGWMAARAAAMGVMALGLVACGSSQRSLDVDHVVVDAMADANGNAALAVDVVMVTDPAVVETVGKLGAEEWFRRKAQIERDFPDGLTVLSWEMVPGQVAKADPGQTVTEAYVFASYATPGEHRVRLALGQEKIRIVLQARDFAVQAADD